MGGSCRERQVIADIGDDGIRYAVIQGIFGVSIVLLVHIEKNADNEDDWDKGEDEQLEQEFRIDGIAKRMCFHTRALLCCVNYNKYKKDRKDESTDC